MILPLIYIVPSSYFFAISLMAVFSLRSTMGLAPAWTGSRHLDWQPATEHSLLYTIITRGLLILLRIIDHTKTQNKTTQIYPDKSP